MVEFTPGCFVAYFLHSRLMYIEFMLGDTDMVDRDPFCFGAEFCERASACVELKPIGVNKIESASIVGLEGRHCISDCIVGCQIGIFLNMVLGCGWSGVRLCED